MKCYRLALVGLSLLVLGGANIAFAAAPTIPTAVPHQPAPQADDSAVKHAFKKAAKFIREVDDATTLPEPGQIRQPRYTLMPNGTGQYIYRQVPNVGYNKSGTVQKDEGILDFVVKQTVKGVKDGLGSSAYSATKWFVLITTASGSMIAIPSFMWHTGILSLLVNEWLKGALRVGVLIVDSPFNSLLGAFGLEGDWLKALAQKAGL